MQENGDAAVSASQEPMYSCEPHCTHLEGDRHMANFPIRLNLIAIALLALGNFALAAEFRSGKDVTVTSEETVKDDLYAAGETITIDGLVEGDLIAFAKDIIINGE